MFEVNCWDMNSAGVPAFAFELLRSEATVKAFMCFMQGFFLALVDLAVNLALHEHRDEVDHRGLIDALELRGGPQLWNSPSDTPSWK